MEKVKMGRVLSVVLISAVLTLGCVLVFKPKIVFTASPTPTNITTPSPTRRTTNTPTRWGRNTPTRRIRNTPTRRPTPSPTPCGINVTVVDASTNDNGYLEQKRILNPNATPVTSVGDMVDKILKGLNSGGCASSCIKELKIIGHGSPGLIVVGGGQKGPLQPGKYINGNQDEWGPYLQQLKAKLCKDAKVILIGCNVGACDLGAAKLQTLADFLGVPVEAPTGKTYGNCTEEAGSVHQKAVPGGPQPTCIRAPSDTKKFMDKDKPKLLPQVPPFKISDITKMTIQPARMIDQINSPDEALFQYTDPAKIQSFFEGIDFYSFQTVELLGAYYNYYVYLKINGEYKEYIICSDYDYFLEKDKWTEVYEITWYLKEELRRLYPTPTPTGRTVTLTPTVTPTPTARPVTPTPTPSNGGYVITYSIASDWGTGATIEVSIKNNTVTPVLGWTIAWTFPGNQTITNLWNGTYTQNGAAVSVNNTASNSSIPVNGSVNFGFNVSYSGSNAKPASFTLNGDPCQVQ